MALADYGTGASKSDISRFYDRISPLYRLVTLMDNKPKRDAFKIASPMKGENVLCIGFGRGEELEWFKNAGCKTIGIDASKGMIKGKRGVILGDGSILPFNNNSFDIVFCSFFFDLIDTRELVAAAEEARRVLKKGGCLVILNNAIPESPTSNMLDSLYMHLRLAFFPSVGIRPIDSGELLKKADFSGIDTTKMYWSLEVSKGYKD